MGCNELFGQFMPRGFKTIPADLGIYAISHYFLTTLIRRLPVFECGRLVRGGESARWLAWDGGDEPEASRPEALSGLPTAGLSVSRLCQHCLLDPSEEARIGFPRGGISCLLTKCPFGSLMVSSTRILAPVLLTASLPPIGVELSAKAQWSRLLASALAAFVDGGLGDPPVEREKGALARSTPVPEPGLMIGLTAGAANDRAKVAAFARSFVRSLTDDRARGHS